MEISKEFMEMVSTDIKKIEQLDGSQGTSTLLKLHRELDGKYQVCVKDWYKGIWGTDRDAKNIWYTRIEDSKESLLENLQLFKAKLETFKFQMNVNIPSDIPSTQVNVTNNVSLTVTFEQVRSRIEDMTSLTSEETNEILEKISELEEIINSKDKKKTKWEKVKPVLVWLADKSFDVGMALLPLLLNLQG